MATTSDLLVDAFNRIEQSVHRVLDGITQPVLDTRIDPDANPVGWLVWHLTRVQDDHIAGVTEAEQVWLANGWNDRFDLPFDRRSIGYGHTTADVAALAGASAADLKSYFDDVHATTLNYVGGLSDADLDRIVDRRWDPPVTLAVRLMSIVTDDLQHVGQASYVRGVVERTG